MADLTSHNRNTRWSRIVAQGLADCGIEHVISCPGGRSAALALTLADQPGLEMHVQNDERAAGFFGLGMARATGRPVAICTTSGSAVANLLPSLLEAESLGVPVLILTCDRPVREQGGGGPQYADHLGLCRPVARRQLALGDPACDAPALEALKRELRRFLESWLRDPCEPGPAQINLPFHGAVSSLDPDPDEAGPAPAAEPLAGPAAGPASAPGPAPPLAGIAALGLPPAPRGLIVAGSTCPFDPGLVAALAERTGFPLLADAASGLRRPALAPTLVAEAELICAGGGETDAALAPDVVVQIGPAPAYHGLHRFLKHQRCPVLILDRHAVAKDFLERDFVPAACGDGAMFPAIGEAIGRADGDWTGLWAARSAAAALVIEEVASDLAWGELPAAMMICNAPGFDLLHLGNSLSVRFGNLLCRPSVEPQLLFANRGVNGIDGTIACFLGEMAAVDGPGLAMIGDLAFLHDFASLELVRRSRARGAVCVLQNHGGAIFDFLPGQELPRFAEIVRNPRPAPIAALAAAFDLPYRRAGDAAALAEALDSARTGETLSIVEIPVPEHSAREGLQMLFLSAMLA